MKMVKGIEHMHTSQFKLHISIAKCLFLLLALLLLAGRLHASELVYTIQSGSFEDMELANIQFDTIAHSLQESEIQHLRIERIEPYFCVRLGRFETMTDALHVLEQLQPRQPLLYEALVLEAYITEDRIKRMYPETGENTDRNEEPQKENEAVPDDHAQKDAKPAETVVEPEPHEKKAEKKQEDTAKPVKTWVPVKKDDDRISLSVQDADIRKVLKGLSIKKDLNIVISQEVQGKISVNVNNLPLHEVLDAIITINGFNYMKKDNIIFVTKGKDEEGETLFDAEVRMFRLQYADVKEAEKVVRELVSESANITLYKPEKTLVIEDETRNLESIAKVLKALDVPPRQVLIETKILQVRLNDDTTLGIDWSDTFSDFFNSSGQVSTQGFTGASQGFFFNIMNGDFSLFLDALNNITEVDTLSSPSLLALDNKEAKIIIGEKLGYYVTTATEATVLQSVEFLDTGTQLVLTPRIIDDEIVIMEIHPEVSDGIVIDGLPSKNTAEVTTNLMAPNGGTIFIGGLLRDKKEDIKNRVPVLGKIPLLGALFSKTTNITSRTEIVVLITPHIISDENKDILARSNERVTSVEEYLREERLDTELLPGTK
jgi:type II secretory pathway component GspD/PulD (secretin)